MPGAGVIRSLCAVSSRSFYLCTLKNTSRTDSFRFKSVMPKSKSKQSGKKEKSKEGNQSRNEEAVFQNADKSFTIRILAKPGAKHTAVTDFINPPSTKFSLPTSFLNLPMVCEEWAANSPAEYELAKADLMKLCPRNHYEDIGTDGIGVQIAAPPVDGEANSALVKYLSKVLGLRKSEVNLDKGSKSRTKNIIVAGNLTKEEIIDKLTSEIDR